MANENYYTYDGSGNRIVQNVGDIEDVITVLGVEEVPIYGLLSKRKIQDNNPKTVEDSLLAVSATNFYAEGATAPAAVDTTRSINQNWAQLLMKTVEVSDTQNEIAQYGMGSEMAYEEPKKVKELLRDVEQFIISNQALQAPTAANSRIAKMAGMGALITTSTSATWSLAVLETQMQTLVNTYGANPSVLYMRGADKISASAFTTTPTRFTTDIKTLEKEVMAIHTNFGQTLAIYDHHLMPQDVAGAGAPHIVLLDPSLWQLAVLIPLRRKVLAITGSSSQIMYEIQICPLCRGEEGNAYWN